MKAEETIAVGRPQRWREPMDASMSDADVSWLRSREPFASMNPKSFSRTMPLEGILRNDCRICRCEPGEIIVREGDYGNSAFLVLAGSVRVVVDALTPGTTRSHTDASLVVGRGTQAIPVSIEDPRDTSSRRSDDP